MGSGPASADVAAVEGSAYGYFASVSLFHGPPNTLTTFERVDAVLRQGPDHRQRRPR